MDVTITNKTHYYISEIRSLRVKINFGDGKTTQFYVPRIELDEELKPGASITVKNLDGNFTSQGIDVSTAPYISVDYTSQTYQVIYD